MNTTDSKGRTWHVDVRGDDSLVVYCTFADRGTRFVLLDSAADMKLLDGADYRNWDAYIRILEEDIAAQQTPIAFKDLAPQPSTVILAWFPRAQEWRQLDWSEGYTAKDYGCTHWMLAPGGPTKGGDDTGA